MPVLYRVTEQQVLASAGLDAFVVSLQRPTGNDTEILTDRAVLGLF